MGLMELIIYKREECVMGTISAPWYAHIFKGRFELNLVYLYVKGKIVI